MHRELSRIGVVRKVMLLRRLPVLPLPQVPDITRALNLLAGLSGIVPVAMPIVVTVVPRIVVPVMVVPVMVVAIVVMPVPRPRTVRDRRRRGSRWRRVHSGRGRLGRSGWLDRSAVKGGERHEQGSGGGDDRCHPAKLIGKASERSIPLAAGCRPAHRHGFRKAKRSSCLIGTTRLRHAR